MGRQKCTNELIEEAVRCKHNGMSNKDMCSVLGISETTLYKWIGNPKSKKQVELVQALKSAESGFKAALRSRIMAKSQDDWKAAAWMLERMYPDEYARRERSVVEAKVEQVPRFYDSREEAEHGN